jgi:hypothetical protein
VVTARNAGAVRGRTPRAGSGRRGSAAPGDPLPRDHRLELTLGGTILITVAGTTIRILCWSLLRPREVAVLASPGLARGWVVDDDGNDVARTVRVAGSFDITGASPHHQLSAAGCCGYHVGGTLKSSDDCISAEMTSQ